MDLNSFLDEICTCGVSIILTPSKHISTGSYDQITCYRKDDRHLIISDFEDFVYRELCIKRRSGDGDNYMYNRFKKNVLSQVEDYKNYCRPLLIAEFQNKLIELIGEEYVIWLIQNLIACRSLWCDMSEEHLKGGV